MNSGYPWERWARIARACGWCRWLLLCWRPREKKHREEEAGRWEVAERVQAALTLRLHARISSQSSRDELFSARRRGRRRLRRLCIAVGGEPAPRARQSLVDGQRHLEPEHLPDGQPSCSPSPRETIHGRQSATSTLVVPQGRCRGICGESSTTSHRRTSARSNRNATGRSAHITALATSS